MKIAIDAGHGFNTAGKRTPDDIREWTLNDRVARGFEQEMKNYDVQVIRLDDVTGKTDVTLGNRTKRANEQKVDYLISIHHNAYQGKWGEHGGTETWIQNAGGKDEVLAKVLNDSVVATLGLRNRGIKVGNMHMNRESNAVSCLVEVGFMDSNIDKAIRDENKSREVGVNMAKAFAKHYGLKLKNTNVKKSNEEIAQEVKLGKWGNGAERKQRLTEAGYDYATIQAIVNGNTPAKITVGSLVRITGTHYATGQKVPLWVKNRKYTVQQISGDRALLREIQSWVYLKDVAL